MFQPTKRELCPHVILESYMSLSAGLKLIVAIFLPLMHKTSGKKNEEANPLLFDRLAL